MLQGLEKGQRLINVRPTLITDYRVFCLHELSNYYELFYMYGYFPIQYVLYGHSIPMDILLYGHFLIHQICMDISLLWTICHMVFLHIDPNIQPTILYCPLFESATKASTTYVHLVSHLY